MLRAHLKVHGTVDEDTQPAEINGKHFHMIKPRAFLSVRKLIHMNIPKIFEIKERLCETKEC